MGNSVYAQLPAVTSGDSIWFIHFLFFTSLFNFTALLEYSVVNFGMQLDAAQKKEEAENKEPKPAEAQAQAAGARSSTPSTTLRARAKHLAIKGKDLDLTCRWLFPLCYLTFIVVMFILLHASYKNNTDCHEHPHF